MTLDQRIREARTARSWSQSALAERAGVSRPTVARIEAGQYVRMATLEAVAQALGLAVELSQVDGSRAGRDHAR